MDAPKRLVDAVGLIVVVWVGGYWFVATSGRTAEAVSVPPVAVAEGLARSSRSEAVTPESVGQPVPAPQPGMSTAPAAPREPAEIPPAPPASEVIHVVGAGDTLSGLSNKYYGSPAWADRIFEANRGVLRSAHDLALGQRLVIPPRP